MAKPQIEDGHSDIANELLEAIIRTHFSPIEHSVFWAIVRKTYGWHKKMDRISFTQLEDLTGINRRHIAPALQGLIKRNIIIRQGEKYNLEYGVQKDYEQWLSLPKSVTNIITDNGNESLPESVMNIVTNISNESLPNTVTIVKKQSLPISAQSLPNNDSIVTVNGTKSLPNPVHTKEKKENIQKKIQKKDGGVPPPDPSASLKNFNEERKKVFEERKKRRGCNSPMADGEASAITWMLKQKYTIDQMLACYDFLKMDKFWQNKPLFMMTVKNNIGEFLSKKGQSGLQMSEEEFIKSWKPNSESGEEDDIKPESTGEPGSNPGGE
jgi:phage replication O-like protein O